MKTLNSILFEADEPAQPQAQAAPVAQPQAAEGPAKQQVTVQIAGVIKAIKTSLTAYSQAMNNLTERAMKKMLAFSAAHTDLAASNEQLGAAIKKLQANFTNHDSELDRVKNALSKLEQQGREEDREEIANLGSQVDQLKASVQENLSKIDQITQELQNTRQAGSSYTQELEKYIDDLTAESDDTRSKLEQLKSEYIELHRKMQHGLKHAPTIHAPQESRKHYGDFDLMEHLRKETEKETKRKGGGWKMGDW